MPLYTVFAPLPRADQSAPDPADFVFVKDGFCWPALFFGLLWVLYRRLWLVLLFALALLAGLGFAEMRLGGPLPGLVLAFAHLLFALEGNSFRRGKLRARGYAFVGVVEGRRSEVELRFFAQWQPPEPPAPPAETMTAPPSEPPPSAPRTEDPSTEAGEVVGLFPAPAGAA